ncbi:MULTISPECIES: DUF1203 domain-containing protein [Actinokineospora]|uniref:DUF1203 domain-containing protein n=1 Tax=Actinokineospora fastidiosa TaxID=1816 RepID=A0A918LEI8_9PSEU|nr:MULTISPECIES: DUF1203 domain-containing protein [Actinokineospora]UVS80696.1 hypothetical protein Actkin_04448 [Actinokineospora sp. UTMC 2448]GGS36514.1 hypothetical protein GCM10010171_34100 [Actinokineospora fastidiosa]
MIQYIAIDPDRLQAMRDSGADESGNPWTLRPADGDEPLRCCLTWATPGEDIALISYNPWTQRSPWAETGPVYVHFDRCAGYSTPGEYPPAFLDYASMLNPFQPDGERAYGHITFLRPEDDHEAAVRLVLAQPDVSYLHVRSANAGCFTFEVRP